jgi:hypothetical protein
VGDGEGGNRDQRRAVTRASNYVIAGLANEPPRVVRRLAALVGSHGFRMGSDGLGWARMGSDGTSRHG